LRSELAKDRRTFISPTQVNLIRFKALGCYRAYCKEIHNPNGRLDLNNLLLAKVVRGLKYEIFIGASETTKDDISSKTE